jgi:hypothetical protein
MNLWLRIVIIVVALAPAITYAGEIRGAVTLGGKSIGPDVAIEVHCGDKVYAATTDKYGFYRLFIPETGTCQFQLRYRNQEPSREVISFEDSTRYDMLVEQDGDKYVLRRK